jgi:hypothetical protein
VPPDLLWPASPAAPGFFDEVLSVSRLRVALLADYLERQAEHGSRCGEMLLDRLSRETWRDRGA